MQIVSLLFCVVLWAMKFFAHRPQPLDIKAVYDKYQQQIDALVEALEAGDPNVDLKLAAMMEGEPSQVRVAIVEKMREQLAQNEEKAAALEQIVEQQKLLEAQQQERVQQQFLAYFLSQQTLRKLREAFMMSPAMRRQVESLGEQLARSGVIGQSPAKKDDLGELSANLQYVQKQQQDKGKGR